MNKLRFFLSAVLLGVSLPVAAQGGSAHAAMARIGYEEVSMPDGEVMGLLGTTYLIETLPHLYFGGAVYSALTGKRGGLFTAGAEIAWQQPLTKNWAWVAGLYAGGGGGGSATALVGGGLMLRPHLDLLWQGSDYNAGLSASQVRFPSGQISSPQFGLVYAKKTDFTALSAGQTFDLDRRSGVGFDRMMAVMGSYQGQVTGKNSGVKRVGFVGFRVEQLLDEHTVWGLETSGAASGGVAGYAEFLGTAGQEIRWTDYRATLGARAAVGMGGGGAVSVGGGLLAKLGIYANFALSDYTHLGLESGYVSAPKGEFRARFVTANLIMDMDHPDAKHGVVEYDRYDWLMGVGSYLDTAHRDGSRSRMDVVTMKVNRRLNAGSYLSGQLHSAYGGKEGGFSAGLVGLGLQIPLGTEDLVLGTELLVGAAGGGAVDSSGGAIMAPNVYADWALDANFSVRLEAGRVKSLRGGLNTPMVAMFGQYAYGTTRRH